MYFTSEKVLPYVYMCVNKTTNEFYIGSRTTKKLKQPSHIDFPNYRTSSKIVKPNFDQYNWLIIAEFFTSSDAFIFEQKLIQENWGNPLLLNGAFVSENVKFNPGQSKQSREKARERMLSKSNPAYNQSKDKLEKMAAANIKRNSKMTKEERSKKYGTFGDKNFFHLYNKSLSLIDKQKRVCKYEYTLISPAGDIYQTISLNDFCKQHNLCRDVLMKYNNLGHTVPVAPPNSKRKSRTNTVGWSITSIQIKY